MALWREPAHRPSPNGPDKDGPLVPAQKVLVASSATFGLTGLDPYTGRVLWRNKLPEGGVTAPVQIAGAIMVGTSRYGIFLLSPRNGRVIDGMDLGTGFAQTPGTFAGRAYAMTNTGTFLGISVTAPLPLKAGSAR